MTMQSVILEYASTYKVTESAAEAKILNNLARVV
jgi:hypothetical protein